VVFVKTLICLEMFINIILIHSINQQGVTRVEIPHICDLLDPIDRGMTLSPYLDHRVTANSSHFFFFTMDKLESLLKLQRELSIELASERYPGTTEQRISSLCLALIHESVELQRLTNWKWWKQPREFDVENAKGELIDMWHFLLQASIELGMTADEILQYYLRKYEINKFRRKSNY